MDGSVVDAPQIVSDYHLNYLDEHLTPDDKEKLRLLLILIGQPVVCREVAQSTNNSKDFWSEALFLIARYDLLKCLDLCEVLVSHRLARPESRVFFDASQRLMLTLYNEITSSMEEKFHNHFEGVRRDQFSSGLNQWIDDGNRLKLSEKMLIYSKNCSDFKPLKEMFVSLRWDALVRKLELQTRAADPRYPMNKSPCGKCLIINNHSVKDQAKREGSQFDVDAMKKTFENFDFIVDNHSDLDAAAMRNVLSSVAGEDHTHYNALVCCIMSHGSQGGIKSADDQLISIDEIISMFTGKKCYSLFGKPKLFLIQACQGEGLQIALSHSDVIAMDGPSNRNIPLTDNPSDHLLGLATQAGSAAIRKPGCGSWFIQALAEAFTKFEDMDSVQRHAQEWVSSKVVQVNGNQLATQIPIWTSTLSKRLVFRRK